MSRSKRLHLASISDIHFGNRRIDHQNLVEALEAAFPDTDTTGELDLIVFAGDVFDGLLSLNNDVVLEFDVWCAKFLRMCKRRDIAVRVLEGTRSHDWGQSSRFATINEQLGDIQADLVYVNELAIRYEKRFDMNFLFVPDDLHHDPNVTLSQVRELLAAKHLTHVDFAFMHGNFQYQLPAHVKIPHHDEHAYLGLVKYLIFIGHIHLASQYQRIYAQGSFDRFSHNEEADKGHLRAVLYDDGNYDVQFVVNKLAQSYVTVEITGLDTEAALERIRQKARTLKDGSGLRVLGDKSNPVFSHLRGLILEFPLLRWTTKENPTQEQLTARIDLSKVAQHESIRINPENITSLMEARLLKLQLEPVVLSKAREILEELK